MPVRERGQARGAYGAGRRGGLEGDGAAGGMRSRAEGYASVVHLDEAVGAPQGGPHLPQACNAARAERRRRAGSQPARSQPSPFAMCPGNQEATSRPPKSKRSRRPPVSGPGAAAARSTPAHTLMATAPLRCVTSGAGERTTRECGHIEWAGRSLSGRRSRVLSAMAEARPAGAPGDTGAAGPGVPPARPTAPPAGPGVAPAGHSAPRVAGPGPQPTPQPPAAPQPAPEPGPTQDPLDDTRFLIAGTNWY